MGERYISRFPAPTDRERELLIILMEECAEAQQCCAKALRFGLMDSKPGQPHNNAYRLGLEIGDLLQVLFIGEKEGLFPRAATFEGQQEKVKRLAQYMQTQAPSPTDKGV